jgi:hypothetical protein
MFKLVSVANMGLLHHHHCHHRMFKLAIFQWLQISCFRIQ